MNVNSIDFTTGYVDSSINQVTQSGDLTSDSNNSGGSSAIGQNPDSSQLSPLAQFLSTLQHLQQGNPTEYQRITAQLSKGLKDAAETAQAKGNTSAADQLNQLAADFHAASTTGQLPNVQDLAKAVDTTVHDQHRHVNANYTADSNISSKSNQTAAVISAIVSALDGA